MQVEYDGSAPEDLPLGFVGTDGNVYRLLWLDVHGEWREPIVERPDVD